ncbi:hypothetical protein ACLKA7_003329 [Drosophila subpalustris]
MSWEMFKRDDDNDDDDDDDDDDDGDGDDYDYDEHWGFRGGRELATGNWELTAKRQCDMTALTTPTTY